MDELGETIDFYVDCFKHLKEENRISIEELFSTSPEIQDSY